MKTKIAVITASTYLIFLSILSYTGISIELSALMYLISPLVIIGMEYLVLIDNEYKYPELDANEEWGYLDKKKSELGLF
jgi:hypothetical protein